MSDQEESISARPDLPFDPWSIALRVWSRRWMIGAGIGISFVFSLLVAGLLGKKTWESETSLIYVVTQAVEEKETLFQLPTLETLVDLVKYRSNIEKTRDHLKLQEEIDEVGASISADVVPDTSLLVIRAEWHDQQLAADIVNSVREFFLTHIVEVRKTEAQQYVDQFSEKLEVVTQELKAADDEFERFGQSDQVIDIDIASEQLIDEFTQFNTLYEQARVDKSTTELQLKDLKKITQKLKVQEEQEKAEQSTSHENLHQLKIRSDRIRETIYDDRTNRANKAILRELKRKYERAQELFKKGIISEAEYDAAKAAYESHVARTVDTAEIKEMRAELKKMDDVTIPKDASTKTSPILEKILTRSFELELRRTELTERVAQLEQSLKRIRDKLSRLPKAQRKYAELKRTIQTKETEQQRLQEQLVLAKNLLELDNSGFSLVSEGRPAHEPSSDSKYLIIIGITFLGILGNVGTHVLLSLLDRNIRTNAEVSLKANQNVIAEIPCLKPSETFFPENGEPTLLEEFRLLAYAVRKQQSDRGVRILVASALPQEGRTSIVSNLAISYGRQDERVLVIDANTKVGHAEFLKPRVGTEQCRGLADYLSFKCHSIDHTIWPTQFAGVSIIPKHGRLAIPDCYSSNRMKELLEELSEDFSLTLIDCSPVLKSADAVALASQCDAVLFVVNSGASDAASVRLALSRLQVEQKPILGVVLNSVSPLYANRT